MATLDRHGIAARLRGLIEGQEGGTEAAAARLGVDEASLRISIDAATPHPTLEVLAAAIEEYGIDPTWLLTGRYDAASHRAAMAGERAAIELVKDYVFRGSVRVSAPTAEPFRRNDQN